MTNYLMFYFEQKYDSECHSSHECLDDDPVIRHSLGKHSSDQRLQRLVLIQLGLEDTGHSEQEGGDVLDRGVPGGDDGVIVVIDAHVAVPGMLGLHLDMVSLGVNTDQVFILWSPVKRCFQGKLLMLKGNIGLWRHR